MRGAVPVLFTAHLLNLAVIRQVSALNPTLRILPGRYGSCIVPPGQHHKTAFSVYSQFCYQLKHHDQRGNRNHRDC